MSDNPVEITSDSILDFSYFYKNHLIPDCTLVFPDGSKILAHRIILSNWSIFFEDAFTSGMQEDSTREVSIVFNPCNLLPAIVNFMYSTSIEINQENLMPLLEISHFYGVTKLFNDLKSKLDHCLDQNNIFDFVDQCYNLELKQSLALLKPYLARLYNLINIQQFSDKLDIVTFCHVLTSATENGIFQGDVVSELNTFLNGTKPSTKEETNELDKVIQIFGNPNRIKPLW
ncbi:BTB/POZ domain containing protein [Tritrichomonas foetus]|uniref:BTB/POZ domain containing protein n=1 Tax=Tritrichomonas foetus TaxID=1144522 RepID=A0A1J4KGV4_9EUKA|nr:BTB/POZ domain containing protein [Tritrichomonas foetus]|eukprot:OHT10274.1 BTB/POZ domain containing protein [Tritrichomonas foetus]